MNRIYSSFFSYLFFRSHIFWFHNFDLFLYFSFCSSCSTASRAIQRPTVYESPKYLIINLKRFEYIARHQPLTTLPEFLAQNPELADCGLTLDNFREISPPEPSSRRISTLVRFKVDDVDVSTIFEHYSESSPKYDVVAIAVLLNGISYLHKFCKFCNVVPAWVAFKWTLLCLHSHWPNSRFRQF